MTTHPSQQNPFRIVSPEDLPAQDTLDLFVDMFTDFPKIIDPGHTFLVGPRGSGKSMMFRYLMPDCQCLARKCTLAELPFFGVYVPLKNTNFTLAELHRLDRRHASDVLSSHLLTTHIAVKVFTILSSARYHSPDLSIPALLQFHDDLFQSLLSRAYGKGFTHAHPAKPDAANLLGSIALACETMYSAAMDYAKRLAFRSDILPYEGPLCDYLDFLLPLLLGLQTVPGLPASPLYLLIDDAHWLSEMQASVLNSWVATRTSTKVSLKISTQPNYSTYATLAGDHIETPHDYSEVDLSTIYTGSRRDRYRDRVSAIVERRLRLAGIPDVTPPDFFPVDEEQEADIRQRGEAYKAKHDDGEGCGHYRGDDAARYARPDYIRDLAGQRKSSSTYSYAGFDQLVHLSSGVLRFFIEPAHTMFAEAQAKSDGAPVRAIPPAVQSSVVRAEADKFLFDDLEKMQTTLGPDTNPPREAIAKLSNLLQGLGGIFRKILLSNRSERRVFSIAFSDTPSDEVSAVLNLGVRLGYFHKSTIGRKDSGSGGRTRLFVLSKRLAPIWTLDPSGFSGYLFVTSALIEDAMSRPRALLRRIEAGDLDEQMNRIQQMELF